MRIDFSLFCCVYANVLTSRHYLVMQAPGFATTCNACGLEIDVGTGMRCPQCTDFDLCNTCGKGPPGQMHPHRLVVRAPACYPPSEALSSQTIPCCSNMRDLSWDPMSEHDM